MFKTTYNKTYWNGLYFSEWFIGVKTIPTTCKSMTDLQGKTNINCKPGKIIFVNEQSINFLGRGSRKRVLNNNECTNSTSSKCFRYLKKDYLSYSNVSKSCNGKEKCSLGYNDMYYSATKFFTSCGESKGSDFDLFRIGVSNDCFNCMYSFNSLHVYYYAALSIYLAFNLWFMIHWKIIIL